MCLRSHISLARIDVANESGYSNVAQALDVSISLAQREGETNNSLNHQSREFLFLFLFRKGHRPRAVTLHIQPAIQPCRCAHGPLVLNRLSRRNA